MNKRHSSQTLTTFYIDKTLKNILINELQKRRLLLSQFIRDALAEKMMRDWSLPIPESIVIPRRASEIITVSNTAISAPTVIGNGSLSISAKTKNRRPTK
jgi:hypothetical protein